MSDRDVPVRDEGRGPWSLSWPEAEPVAEGDGGGEEERVEDVEDAAEARDDGGGVLAGEVALDQ